MSIIGGFMVPHPPIIIPEIGRGDESLISSTVKAYGKVADIIADIKPDTIVVISPHTVMYSDYFHISPGEGAEGTFARFGIDDVGIGADYDTAFVKKLCLLAAETEMDAGVGGEKDKSLDHGTLIPLYFITKKYVDFDLVRIGLSGLPLTRHYELGMLIKRAATELGRRTVIIASGDLSHKLKEDGPYGFVKEGPVYDEKIMDVMAQARFGALLDFDELYLEKVGECGHRSFTIMAGAFDRVNVKAERLSYEGPYGVGYGICTFVPEKEDDSRNFLDIKKAKDKERLLNRKANEDEYVKLARASLETYVRTGKHLSINEAAPFITEEMKNKQAGAFVSLHKDGRLRGCIGTTAPTKSNVAWEIVENAVAAAANDPRFLPVDESELEGLEYSVDVLFKPHDIDGPDELDVKKYGVIVRKGNKRGLLLPNLDTIETVEEQIAVAKRKAGIGEDEEVSLQRFEVVRHF